MSPDRAPYRDVASRMAALLILGALASPASAQRADDDWLEDCQRERDDRYTYCDVRVERLSAGSSLTVNAHPNGGIEIVGQNRNDIEVHARIQARAASSGAARDIGEAIRLRMDSRSIGSDGPSTDDEESWHVSWVIFVPDRLDLELEANNGPLSVSTVEGRITAETHNGPLSLRDLGGDVYARTRNGPLNVSLSGSSWSGRRLDAETHNGPVNLVIPDGYSAELETGTVNGPFRSDVPLTVTQLGRRSRRIETTLGRGGAPIRAVTTNGPVTITAK